jgi:hypothetical protein
MSEPIRDDRRCVATTTYGLQCGRFWGASGTIVGTVLCPVHERMYRQGKPITIYGGETVQRTMEPPTEGAILATVRTLCPPGFRVVPTAEHDALMALLLEVVDEFVLTGTQMPHFHELMGRLAVIDDTYRTALAPEAIS